MNAQKLTKVFGVVFVLIGVLGFVPGITANGMLLGIFEVDALHNSIHLLTGIAALAAVKMHKTDMFLKVFGVVYALVAVLGFVMGGSVLGLFHANMADNLLHLAVAVAFLYGGFMLGERRALAPASAPTPRTDEQTSMTGVSESNMPEEATDEHNDSNTA